MSETSGPQTPLEAKSPFELRVNLGKGVPESDVRSALATGDMGFLHSFTTGSTVDGPGVRVVAWTTGCMWRCLYCHNPDTWTHEQRHAGDRREGGRGAAQVPPRLEGHVRRLHPQRRRAADAASLRGEALRGGDGHGHPHDARYQRLLRRPAHRRRARHASTW